MLSDKDFEKAVHLASGAFTQKQVEETLACKGKPFSAVQIRRASIRAAIEALEKAGMLKSPDPQD